MRTITPLALINNGPQNIKDNQLIVQADPPVKSSTAHHHLFDQLLEHIADGILVCDEKGYLEQINQAAIQLLKISAPANMLEDCINTTAFFKEDKLTPWPAHELLIKRVLQGEVVKCEQVFALPEHAETGRFLLISTTPRYDTHGKFKGAIISFTDVSKSRKTEEELKNTFETFQSLMNENYLKLERKVRERTEELDQLNQTLTESERKYRILVDNAMVGIFKCKKNGEIIYVNKAVAIMYGLDVADQVYQHKIGEMFKKKSDLIDLVDLLEEFGTVQNFEFEGVTQEGTSKNIVISAALKDGIISGVALDVTDRVRAEQKLAQAHKALAHSNHNLTKSIQYAKRIQDILLPAINDIKSHYSDAFVLYQPRDIVSGDFYWFHYDKNDNKSYIAAVDCTGHGVPGAFMAMLGHKLLEHIIVERKIIRVDIILEEMNRAVVATLKQRNGKLQVKEGMDMALVCIDHRLKKLSYAGAKNPLYLIRDNELRIFKADRQTIGGHSSGHEKEFEKVVISFQPKDRIYLFSDGYTDQFGGQHNRRFKNDRLQKLLLSTSKRCMQEQQKALLETFQNWKKDLKQIDDILIVGVEL